MKLSRTTFIRVTPKTKTKFVRTDFVIAGGLGQLLKAIARVLKKIFGLLYLNTSRYVGRSRITWGIRILSLY